MGMYNETIETMERDELSKLQLERLQHMVDYCIEHVPFYKETFSKAGITSGKQIQNLSDISILPFTTKHDIANTYPKGLLAVPMNNVAKIHASSGTTGNPKIGYYTANDLNTWSELTARVLSMSNLTSSDVLQISLNYGLFTGGLGFDRGAEKIGCSIIPASSGNTWKQLVLIKDLNVTTLQATPSYALYLSELIKANNTNVKINKVLLGAERCTKSIKENIKKNLQCDVYENYGLTEFFGPGVAGECTAHNGMHINEDIFYPEIIDSNTGEVLEDGKQGELVLTSLHREAMPLIRYRTGDITSITHEKCKCGRTLVRMEAPYARVDDMFVFKGINIYPSQIEHVLDSIDDISPYYLIKLERKDEYKDIATLYIELQDYKNTYTDKAIKQIKENITNKLKEVVIVHIDIELVDPNTLERFTGKSKRVEDLRYSYDN